jgi:molybdopterin converting factor subunit 1
MHPASPYDVHMRCDVLLFAQARDVAGCDRLAIDLPAGATAADALDAIIRMRPPLESLRHRLAVAVDARYAPPSAPLRDGCTIALIPPVSGG